MNTCRKLSALLLILLSTSSYAARPTSIVFETERETGDGTPFAQYSVTCSDGRTVQLTAWEGRRKWCVGDGEARNCSARQISAAKSACMNTWAAVGAGPAH
jgi:hypothetical protein